MVWEGIHIRKAKNGVMINVDPANKKGKNGETIYIDSEEPTLVIGDKTAILDAIAKEL